MKQFLALVLLISLASCTSMEPIRTTQGEYEVPVYMTKDQVMAEIANPTLEIKSDVNDAAFQDRMLSLVPLTDLFKMGKTFKSVKSIKAVDISKLPVDVDLRNQDSAVKDQGQEGLCTSFGLTGAQEATHCALNKQCNLNLSERHRWLMYKQYSADAAMGTIAKPVAPESICPYSKATCPATVNSYAKYQIGGMTKLTSKNDVLAALAAGKHVYFWSQVPKQMVSCSKTITSNVMADGGHAYKISGYFNKENPILILKNSWGPDCANLGYQYMSFSIFDKAGYWGAASMESTSVLGTVPNAPKCEQVCGYLRLAKNFWVKRYYCWQECK